MAKVKTKQVKAKKKQWMPIFGPKNFDTVQLGETYVSESSDAVGKSVTTSLMVLTDDPKQQAYTIRFDVTSVKEGQAHTQVIGMNMTPSAAKRLIRRHRDKISDSFVLRIGGGRLIRVKPMLVTRTRTSKPAQTEIRLLVRKKLRDLYQKMRIDDIILDIIDMKTQRMLKNLCGKTHPIRTADIREIVILPEGRNMTKEMEELLEKEAVEEEARRQQLASAAAAASVEEEAVPTTKPRKKAPVKKEEPKENSEKKE